MITLTLVAILGVLLVIVLMKLFNHQEEVAAPRAKVPDLANLKVTDARVGDMISVSGAGDDLSDLDFTADRCAWFEAGPRRWFELSGGYRERRVALRVATGGDIEAVEAHSVTLGRGGQVEHRVQVDRRIGPGDRLHPAAMASEDPEHGRVVRLHLRAEKTHPARAGDLQQRPQQGGADAQPPLVFPHDKGCLGRLACGVEQIASHGGEHLLAVWRTLKHSQGHVAQLVHADQPARALRGHLRDLVAIPLADGFPGVRIEKGDQPGFVRGSKRPQHVGLSAEHDLAWLERARVLLGWRSRRKGQKRIEGGHRCRRGRLHRVARAGTMRRLVRGPAFSDHPLAPGLGALIFISHRPQLINQI